MLKSLVALGALASTFSFAVAQAPILPAYPSTQILPVPGWNSTTDGFNSLGDLYVRSAAQLSAQAVILAQKNVELTGAAGAQYNGNLKASLSTSLAIINNVFWQTAYQAELKVCAISTSINQQNVDTVSGSLRAGIFAEFQAVVSVTLTLANTIVAVKAQLAQFTDAERVIITTLIQAIATAATASIGPIIALNNGLTSTGVLAIADVSQSLQVAVTSLQTAATLNWTIT